MDCINVIIGGIKAEYEILKSERQEEDEFSIVEIKAEDIGENINNEPEETSAPLEHDESNTVSNGNLITDSINKTQTNNPHNRYNTRSKRQKNILPETDKIINKKNKANLMNNDNIPEKLVLNYITNTDLPLDLPNVKEKTSINYNKSQSTLKRKPVKKSHSPPKTNNNFKKDKVIFRNEYSIGKDTEFRSRYTCNHCQTVMTNKELILQHIRYAHRDSAVFNEVKEETLKDIGKTARKKVAWYEYTPESDDQYRCRHCQFLINDRKQIIEHIKSKHRVVGFFPLKQCPHCPFRARNLTHHKQFNHTAEKYIQYFKCYKCDFKAKIKGRLRRHILAVHTDPNEIPDQMNKCSQCPKMFKTKIHLRGHIRYMHTHTVVFKEMKCFLCSYTCKAKISMIEHNQRFHSQNLQPKQCPHCPFVTKFPVVLSRHLTRKHSTIHQCHMCPYQSPKMTRMQLHIIWHKKEKDEEDLKYRCDRCDYKTYREYNLQIHKLNHLKPEEIKYFYCYHCNFKAKRKDNLKTHIFRLHKRDKPTFTCFICDFTTKKKDQLVRHVDKHSKESKNVKKRTKVILSATK